MARGLNKVLLIGNLGADPEVRYTADGLPIATLRLATSRRRRDPNGNMLDETEWHRIVAWERLAELAQNYLHKGRQVYVEGRLQTTQWEDRQGQKRYTTEIVASEITLLGGGQREGGEEVAVAAAAPRATTKPPGALRADSGYPAALPPVDEMDDAPFD